MTPRPDLSPDPAINPNTAPLNMRGNAATRPPLATAGLFLADGTVIWGKGFGKHGRVLAEVCFNTSMAGYQEILTDPSYSGQMITFTFPHIGIVGCNADDTEADEPAAKGMIVRELPTQPSCWRARESLESWMVRSGITGLAGVDTRALTMRIRDGGAPSGVLFYPPDVAAFDTETPAQLVAEARAWRGLEDLDLAAVVSRKDIADWTGGLWQSPSDSVVKTTFEHGTSPHVVAVDYGAKQNILRHLVDSSCRVTVVPADISAEALLALKPDGVFLSNGPGDPAATGVYAVPMIRAVLETDIPLFGICLGHQLLALALGGQTRKMHMGHRGGNHPVLELKTNRVTITSQNHGFEVLAESLPDTAEVTHTSLFDGTNEGIALKGREVFSVQYHPEASPGPHDAHPLFVKFANAVKNYHIKQTINALAK